MGFEIGAYDRSRPLVIDPLALVYSTFHGGSQYDEARGIAANKTGFAFVTGIAVSTNFPLAFASQATFAGGAYDGFVSKFDPAGADLVYSTYIGGRGTDEANAVAVDLGGSAFVVGDTSSSDFPTTADALQSARNGPLDAFLAELGPAGTLEYGTYFGGSGSEWANGVAVKSDVNVPASVPVFAPAAYIVGTTSSSDLPTRNPYQPALGSALIDAFFAAIQPSAPPHLQLVYSTYLGGDAYDEGHAIAVDADGDAYVAGQTSSADFPTANALQGTLQAGGIDAFVARIKPVLAPASQLVFSTYLGGSSADVALGIAADSGGDETIVSGYTGSSDFPTAGAIQTALGGQHDCFVTKLGGTGTSLQYSTYFGGTGTDRCHAIAADDGGNAHLAGFTTSSDFQVLEALQPVYGGGTSDAFVFKLDATGSLLYSSFLGGLAADYGFGVALDAKDQVYVAGMTLSSNFPTLNPLQPLLGQGQGVGADAFVLKLHEAAFDVGVAIDTRAVSVAPLENLESVYALTNRGIATAPGVVLKAIGRGLDFMLVDLFTTQGRCALTCSHRGFACDLGDVVAGGTVYLRLILKPLEGPGQIDLSVKTKAKGRDTNRLNNQVLQTVAVR